MSEGSVWRWMALPLVVAAVGALVMALGTGSYLLFLDIACPDQARFEGSCYSGDLLAVEKAIFLLVAGLTGLAGVLSAYYAAPSKRFLAAQWIAFVLALVAALAVLALDWGMWPLLSAFGGGMVLGLVVAKIKQRNSV
ncbi:hypothetical protein DV711_11500 [Motiliproteus coralliicola]|uniref:Uncharacterized protein n=1 Tax=Motiliproteus coralliicola TaxID=2283196 RepID=A0A369WEC9_9GAMM|nr:hypothetical protein [Motiliproteus coralliicola]RDE19509.1 hypothetical protein DV711_11500 [Motiliproteus coralliicola]